ncbi:MAG: hypothetical protein LM558_00020 [Thermosphaera sp.]|nr:hypothetical protein [Thermosphaera sp.]
MVEEKVIKEMEKILGKFKRLRKDMEALGMDVEYTAEIYRRLSDRLKDIRILNALDPNKPETFHNIKLVFMPAMQGSTFIVDVEAPFSSDPLAIIDGECVKNKPVTQCLAEVFAREKQRMIKYEIKRFEEILLWYLNNINATKPYTTYIKRKIRNIRKKLGYL